MAPLLSVVLASRNGEAVIAEALESLLRQSLPPEQYEIIVVNNGSTDRTAEIADDFRLRYPDRIRVVEEPLPGLSRARNAGVRAARAPVIAFLDDDARAGPGWLEALGPAFADAQVAAAGGPIELTWTCPRPPWWTPELDYFVQGRCDYGARPRHLQFPQVLYGSNLAVRRAVFAELGLFRESLGRAGPNLISGEEVELELRIYRAGFAVAYQPAAVVTHLAVARRATPQYLRHLAWWAGRSQRRGEAMVRGLWLKPGPLLPLFLLRKLASCALKHRFSLASQRELIFYLAYAREALAQAIHPLRPEPPPTLSGPGPQAPPSGRGELENARGNDRLG